MFTREQWKGDFRDCCKPSKEISGELYNYFPNVLPPISLCSGALMHGFSGK